ncbi:MAG: DUF2905 domain-containing protein [Thermoanaerobaculia bacterium]|nr:DUF2905 domain-containing protein [Thermoanaerobaculia bacterium]
MHDIGRILIGLGIALVAAGAIYMVASRFGLARLPGDFVFRRGNFTCIVLIATSILLSILLTLVFWLLRSR